MRREGYSPRCQSAGESVESGAPRYDMEDEFRDWIIDFGDSGYVVRYRVGQRFVMVLAVRHQKEVGF